MLLLAFDTAGPNCAVAVARPGASGPEILSRAEERIGRGHAERLEPMAKAALATAGASYADLERIAVTTGPGSFTGVRVGIAFARGLALALDIPAIGIGSLEALAHPLARRRAGSVVALLDAKRGEVYALVRDATSDAVLVDSEAVGIDDLVRRLSQARRPIVLTGAGAPLVTGFLPDGDATVAATAEAPDIGDVVELALRGSASGPPVPHYARSADAKPQSDKAVARL